MSSILLAHEPWLRLAAFTTVFVSMAVLEALAPRRRQALPRASRWPSNIAIAVLDTLFARIVLPAGAVGVAMAASARGWGVFNGVAAPDLVAVLVSVLALDCAIYWQHVGFHKVPWLWRLHRMHHADTELDVTSGARFHPGEIMLSLLIKLAVIAALGAPPVAVLIFEVLLNATAMFNHANVRVPDTVDRMLRLILVTPDMHRVHHSVIARETNSNYGFNLPWWDRLFGTYRADPAAGQTGMTIGLREFRSPTEHRLDRMLTQPFRNQ